MRYKDLIKEQEVTLLKTHDIYELNMEPWLTQISGVCRGLDINRHITEEEASIFIKNNVIKLNHPMLRHIIFTLNPRLKGVFDSVELPSEFKNYIFNFNINAETLYGILKYLKTYYKPVFNLTVNLGVLSYFKKSLPTIYKDLQSGEVEFDLEIPGLPLPWYTFHVTGVSRSLTHELVRHNFQLHVLQRSTRHGKFTYFNSIKPDGVSAEDHEYLLDCFYNVQNYLNSKGYKQEVKRLYLPHCLEAPLIITISWYSLMCFMYPKRVLNTTGKASAEINNLVSKFISLVKG